jgi:uncharacterized cupredoxin-like copper-binding protein
MKKILPAVSFALFAAAAAHDAQPVQQAFGVAGDSKKISRTVTVSMSDTMRFEPASIRVQRGETVKFVVRNDGKLMHELVLGTLTDLKAHAEAMRKHPGMAHDEPHLVHVKPGKTQSLVWHFNRSGEFHFACLVAGHFEAGMVGTLAVQ